MSVSEIGEEGLITLLAERLPRSADEIWIGDDAAVFEAPRGNALFTTDTMVEGVDFDLSYCEGAHVGWKALAVNVSDIAAMGGAPGKALTTLCLPAHAQIRFVESLLEGLIECASAYGVDLVGGDISSAGQIVIGVALLGSTGGAPWLRSGARAGDALCVTGALGGSHAGLTALQADAGATGPAVDRHLRPPARVPEATALRGVGVHAAIDISDGLVIDLDRLLRASAVGCEVDLSAVPLDASAGHPDDGLYGGEDFELLVALDDGDVDAATEVVAGCGTALTRIGTVTTGAATIDGVDLERLKERSWDHLRSR